ncbi:NAD(P)H-binding protein [Acidobacterium sp. S8]|uniref:NmrA family NAD(P)-binding protein n=1 Tax=Acidobacterium sp. S8 TaxID=1641854 RepID=UPI00131D8C30|nr:NAD(P)H-binding protein [Acidobacterium sp. S8]
MYLVTGATGNVGREVTGQLLQAGEKVRVFTRDASKVAHWGDRVEIAVGDFTDQESFRRAAAGVKGVFLMNGILDNGVFRKLVAAAKDEGVERITFLSSAAANHPELLMGKLHKDKEDAIRESGVRGSFLRPNGFMSNTYQWGKNVKADGVVYNPMGSGRFAPIAPEDIAAVAVKTLTDGESAGEILELTGGELIDVPEEVSILSRILGKELRCVEITTEAAAQGLVQSGIPEHVAKAVAKTFETVREGQAAVVKDTFEKLMGRRPMTFEEWAKKHASRFA